MSGVQVPQCPLKFLYGLNYFYSQNHVELINEPWLVADIIITRPLYWCGFRVYCDLLQRYRTWRELHSELDHTESAFWLCLAVIRTEYASDEVRDNFFRVFPSLTDRTLDAIAGLTCDHAEGEFRKKGTPIEEGIEKRLFKYDHRFHPDIRGKIIERKWINLEDHTAN